MSTTVKIKCYNGKTYDLVVNPNETVAQVQTKIKNLSGIAEDRQTILFKGQVLDVNSTLDSLAIGNGSTMNVVRRAGAKAPAAAAAKAVPQAAAAGGASSATAAATTANDTMNDLFKNLGGADAPMPNYEEMMKNLGLTGEGAPDLQEMMRNLGALGGTTGVGGAGSGANNFEDMMKNLNLGGGASGGFGGAGAGAGGMPTMGADYFQQAQQMISNMFSNPDMQNAMNEYLNDPAKQEESREAIRNNPMLKSMLAADPEFAAILEDPEKWRKNMEQAKSMLGEKMGSMSKQSQNQSTAASKITASIREKTAASVAPPGVNVAKLSEAYGHALGMSLVNSGLGLDSDLVVKGLKSACRGDEFPMAFPEYERQMGELQALASEFVAAANLEDANKFFEETSSDSEIKVIEPKRIVWEAQTPPTNGPEVGEDSNIFVVLQGRLLDDRRFFTCPAADEKGEQIHPLPIQVSNAPPALKKGLIGMKEGEVRTLYVHPEASEGMSAMFGELLPPNALLIFDIDVVSANAPTQDALDLD